MTIEEIADDVRTRLSEHLAPADVSFRGSIAANRHDQYSDIDLQANVHIALDGRFYSSLEAFMTSLYGSALIRYDPDFKGKHNVQNVRFSFYRLPIFWRIDLTVESDREAGAKYPMPFPEWATGTSALMNVVWALKYHQRGDVSAASRLMACACEKVGQDAMAFSWENALAFVGRVGSRVDTDKRFARMVTDYIHGEPKGAGDASQCA
jgi:hypothetical protein